MTVEQLEQLRAARLDLADLPAATTRRAAGDYARDTAALDHRLTTAKAALATLAELSTDDADADAEWLGHLETWRKVLCDELLAIPSPVRDKQVLGRRQTLTFSIKCVDFGPDAFRDTGWELESSALGALMVASGYEVVGADPSRHFGGTLPWHGSIKEVERRLRDRARRRAQAEEQLASALMDDADRAKQEAETKKLRDVANTMNLRIGDDGRLRLFGANNQTVDEASLTELQRAALDFTRRAFAMSV
jgi:hypothetical protein